MGKQDAARKSLLVDLKADLDLLSDDDPDNDYMGYEQIAMVMMHTGDDLNALSAWSLHGPSDRYNGCHELKYPCDGKCGKILTFAEPFLFCKVCGDARFDEECLQSLKNGTLKRFVCSQGHEWLRAPNWNEEYGETGRDRVINGGKLEGGKRVRGQIVAVEEWLDMVRKDWGIHQPLREMQDEVDEQEGPESPTMHMSDPGL